MTKWWEMYGKDHPEAFGEIKEPESNEKSLYLTDLSELNYELTIEICNKLGINTVDIIRKYMKTRSEQKKRRGL